MEATQVMYRHTNKAVSNLWTLAGKSKSAVVFENHKQKQIQTKIKTRFTWNSRIQLSSSH